MFGSHRRIGMRTALRALVIALVIPLTTVMATPAHAAGTISGTVTSTVGGAPLANVEVDVYTPLVVGNTTTWEFLTFATTNGSGQYSLALENGTYRLGFVDLDGVHAAEFYNNVATVDLAANVVVANGALTRDAILAPMGWIGGTVTNAAGGAPIADVEVLLYVDEGNTGDWVNTGSAVTDSSGNYQLFAPAGTYRIGFDGYAAHFSSEFYNDVADVSLGTSLSILAGAGNESKNATLEALGVVSGTVTDGGTGDPLANIAVGFYANHGTTQLPDWQWEFGVVTDADGFYEHATDHSVRVGFEDPSQTYVTEFYNDKARVDQGATLALQGGALFPNTNAALARAGHITGTVTDADGAPLDAVEVSIYRNEGTAQSPQWEVLSSGFTEANGNYDVPAGAGTYRVGFFRNLSSPVFYDTAGSVNTADNVVVVGSATVPNVDAVLERAPEVLSNTSSPRISGTAKVGSTLTVSPGTWAPSGPTVTYTWLASGKAIAGAHATSFKLTGAQVGKRITVLATASKAGVDDGAALTAATSAVVVKPTMALTDKVKRGKLTLKVRVTASGVQTVAGKVKIFRKSKLLDTVKLKAGKVKVKLGKQKPGKAKYTAKYVGSGWVLPVKERIKVRV